MGVKVTNNAFGTLSAAINTTATTITLDSGQGSRFPTLGASDHFYGTLVDTSNNLEIVKVTARSTDSLTVVRGQDGTSGTAFAIGDRFELRPVAALFEDLGVDGIVSSANATAMTIDANEDVTFSQDVTVQGTTTLDTNVSVGGESTFHSGQVGSSNRYLQVHGPSGAAGVLSLGRDTNADNQSLGEVRFYNSNNADDANNDADGKMVAVVQARAETTDSNAGDDSGAHLIFSTKPEAGSLDSRLIIDSEGKVGIGNSAQAPSNLLHVQQNSNGNSADFRLGDQQIRRGTIGVNSSQTRYYKMISYANGNMFTGDVKLFVNRGGGFNQTSGFRHYNASIVGFSSSIYGIFTDMAHPDTTGVASIHLGTDEACLYKSNYQHLWRHSIFFI